MTITSNLRFLYIFDRSGLLCAAAAAIAQLILIDKFRSIVRCIFLATLLRYCIPFFFIFMHAGKNLQSTFFLEFLSFFGENNRKLLYGSLTLLKVNLLTENPFLTCCHAHKSAKVFTKSYLNILRRIIF